MIKQTENLSFAEKVHHADRHRRVHYRHAAHNSLERFTFAEEQAEKEARLGFLPAATGTKPEQRKPGMRVLLLHAKTHKYLQSAARWTRNSKRARDFHNGWWAAIHAFTMDPRHLVIQYQFDDDRYNLNIPVLGHAKA